MNGNFVFARKITALFLMLFISVSVFGGCKKVVLTESVPPVASDVQKTNSSEEESPTPTTEATSSAASTSTPIPTETAKPAQSATAKPTQTATQKPTATVSAPAKPTATNKPVVTATPTANPSDDTEKFSKADYMHISFDDVIVCFEHLATEKYSSVWDEPFFKWLNSLHVEYGVKVSLYTYNDVLSNVSEKYASQFNSAKDWLKIGFHSNIKGRILYSGTYTDGLSYWNEFVHHVVRITGSYDSVDRVPRLEGFIGSLEMLKGMRDANHGAIGFLSADDSRLSYYLDRQVADCLYTQDYIIDRSNNLVFISTDFRAEWYEVGYTNTYRYRKPTESSLYEELEKRENSVAFEPTWKSLIFFTHEYRVYNGESIRDKGALFVEDMCKFAVRYNLKYDYPQNRVYSPTENDYLFNE